MPTETRETKRRIASFLRDGGKATLHEIARELGGDWLAERNVLLRQMIARMAKRGLVEKLEYGVYGPGADKHRHYVDARDYSEKRIAAYLCDRGGHAETDAIHAAIGQRDLRRGARDPSHQAITKTLAESSRFHQQLGRGVWHLPREELEELPLTGYWAARWIERDWETGERDGFQSWQARRDAFFTSVGRACRTARDSRDPETITRDGEVGSALAHMALKCPKVKLACYAEMEAEAERDLARAGVTDKFRIDSEARARRDELPLHLLSRFEEGESDLHAAAPIEFYRALAGLYGVSGAKLTRGEVSEPLPSPL